MRCSASRGGARTFATAIGSARDARLRKQTLKTQKLAFAEIAAFLVLASSTCRPQMTSLARLFDSGPAPGGRQLEKGYQAVPPRLVRPQKRRVPRPLAAYFAPFFRAPAANPPSLPALDALL